MVELDKQTASVFIVNPVAEILESKLFGQLFHVLSEDNPAVTRTRGVFPDSLKQSSWVNGPSFFLKTYAGPFNQNREVTKNGAPGWCGLQSE